MEFSPSNHIVKLCLAGMAMQAKEDWQQARDFFKQAWQQATDDFEKFLAAYFVGHSQSDEADKLHWLEIALSFALKTANEGAKSAWPTLHEDIAATYESIGDLEKADENRKFANAAKGKIEDKGPFFHGTKADLKIGDLLTAGYTSNYDADLTMNHIYFTALMNGAGLAASLAKGDGNKRVYVVEPTGGFENDPNVTDKKFPGNLTRSYRTSAPLKIVGEVTDWARQTPLDLKEWRKKLTKTQGQIIN